MTPERQESIALAGLMLGFCTLAGVFLLEPFGRVAPPTPNPPAPPESTNAAPVRVSAAELFRTEGDTSGFACYSCHAQDKPPVVNIDAEGVIKLPEAHQDIVISHGGKGRNDHCYNCHDPRNLEQLRVRDTETFKFTEANRLCASCHGPTYRDWEKGAHGRTVGHWNPAAGPARRTDCTSCHDPHAPAFPSLKPAPAPARVHVQASIAHPQP